MGFARLEDLRIVRWAILFPLAASTLVGLVLGACSSDDEDDSGPIVWVSPTKDSQIDVGDSVELTVKVNVPDAKVVRFEIDGKPLATCDTTKGPNECQLGDLFRHTTTFESAGAHHLVATSPQPSGDLIATLDIDVRSASPVADDSGAGAPDDGGATIDAGDAGSDAGTTKPVDRGFLDPDRALHNVFGGVSWSVKDQRVLVTSPPTGSTTAVADCMTRYGTSIIKHADAYKISRASVVATAITESNCTNPAGSSDGLSSGPMQVTGSTCASLVSGYTSAACKTKMHDSPDFSFMVGAKYMGSSYQLKQHDHDPPKIAAAYNAGSIRQSSANRWHMVVTGNHLERWVGAYNAYREWESMTGAAKLALQAQVDAFPTPSFDGQSVSTFDALPPTAREGQVYFVGDWARREGGFVTFRNGSWQPN
jgi:Transglycosylase SLT domain